MLDKVKSEQVFKYLLRRGRPLDIVRYRFHLGDTAGLHVLQYLSAYQNPDGGYGHGLDPDILTPASSPLATWAATRILRKIIESPVTESQVIRMFDYLRDTPDFVDGRWRACVPAMNDSPHAPWWHFDEEHEAEVWKYNPTAELAGFILRFKPATSSLYALAEDVVREMVPKLMSEEYQLDGHELSNVTTMYKDLLIAGRLDLLPEDFGEFLKRRVRLALTEGLADYRAGVYGNIPSLYIMGKDSPYYEENKEAAEDYADFLEESLQPEGYWNPNWTWGEQELPPEVLADWRSALSVENLLYLKGLGRA